MGLQLLRSDAPAPRRRYARENGMTYYRRRRRSMARLAQAIRYGLARPDTEPGRQARLLADIFGPQLGIETTEYEPDPRD